MKRLLFLLNVFLSCSVIASDIDVKLNIKGVVRSSTCLIESNLKTSFDMGNILAGKRNKMLGGGMGTKSEWTDGKRFDFNCPSNLLLRAQIEGKGYPSSENYIMSTDENVDGFAFILGYAYPDDDKNKITLFSLNSKKNLLNPSNPDDTSVRTKAGISSVYVYAQLVQVAENYQKGTLNSAVTLNISYQ